MSLAAVEEKQTRRHQNNIPSPPSLSSLSDCGVEKVGAMGVAVAGQRRDVSPNVATVEVDVSAEAKKRKRKKKVKKEREEQPLVQDSCPLMILGGRVNERKCGDVLIDGGASSNFALRSWAKQAGLRIRPLSAPIDVTLADRGSVSRVRSDLCEVNERLRVRGGVCAASLRLAVPQCSAGFALATCCRSDGRLWSRDIQWTYRCIQSAVHGTLFIPSCHIYS